MKSTKARALASTHGIQTVTGLIPGDRLELPPWELDAEQERLRVPMALSMLWGNGAELILEDGNGLSETAHYDPSTRALEWPHWGEVVPQTERAHAHLWLEYVEPEHYRVVWEKREGNGGRALPNEALTEQGVTISFEPEDQAFVEACEYVPPARMNAFQLSLRAAELASHPGFSQLICLPMVREMETLEHQTRTAKMVLRQMRGRAMLCDEVGLGKTIEAGLVLSELVTRGLVRSVLLLVPPSLIEQWEAEMRRKFSLDFVTHDSRAFRKEGDAAWGTFDHVLASFHTAKREPHRSAILERNWDMVIIDEAHHLRNRTTQLWRFASQIRKQFILLLTATPVQNNLDELFNLVTLLEPGLLSTAKRFQKEFVDRKDKLTPRNVDKLHELLSEVMVRNQRSTVGLQLTRRWARAEQVELGPEERNLYDEVTRFVGERLGRSGQDKRLSRMALLVLQMEMGSSAPAAQGTLEKLALNERLDPADQTRLMELAEMAALTAENAKVDRLLELMAEVPDKLVVFTQFRGTQEMLRQQLEQAGYSVSLFHGGLSRLEKERQIERFRHETKILLTTDSGSEGRNLQFCNAICNFDLPWNPMRVEQRIGRLSRIGQERDVLVFNLVAKDTIEAAILHLLDAKLAMFELVIGEIDMVLGNLDEEQEFADLVADLWGESADLSDFTRRMDQLGDRLLAAKEAYFQQRAIEEQIFGDELRPKE